MCSAPCASRAVLLLATVAVGHDERDLVPHSSTEVELGNGF